MDLVVSVWVSGLYYSQVKWRIAVDDWNKLRDTSESPSTINFFGKRLRIGGASIQSGNIIQ